ncbi:hypothetical protein M8C21_016047, partial [Ambrosia artemisiifolia]
NRHQTLLLLRIMLIPLQMIQSFLALNIEELVARFLVLDNSSDGGIRAGGQVERDIEQVVYPIMSI